MASTELEFIVTVAGPVNLTMVPVPGQAVADFGAPVTQLRLQFVPTDPLAIGFQVNQRYLLTLQKLS